MKFRVRKMGFPDGMPQLPGYVVTGPAALPEESDAASPTRCVGAALGLDDDIALKRAVSEAVERCAISRYRISDMHVASPVELGSDAVPLSDFTLFSQQQYAQPGFPYRRVGPEQPIAWVDGVNLYTDKNVYVPAGLVYPEPDSVDLWPSLDKWTTSGVAAAPTLDAAVLNAVCELLERDACMLWWLTKRNAVRVDSGEWSSHDAVQHLRQLVHAHGWRDMAFVITNDMGISTVVVVLVDCESQPRAAFGSSCKVSLPDAVAHAYSEAIMIARTQRLTPPADHGNGATSLLHHVLVPTMPQFRATLDQLAQLPASGLEAIRAHPTSGTELLQAVRSAGYDTYCVYVLPGLLAGGEHVVVRAIIPGLHPLETDHTRLHLDLRRLRSFTGTNRGQPIGLTVPHPFG